MGLPNLEKIRELLEPTVREQGVILFDLEFVNEYEVNILRLYIDGHVPITMNDCEKVSRAVESVLDVEDPIPCAYTLEVSSSGERKGEFK